MQLRVLAVGTGRDAAIDAVCERFIDRLRPAPARIGPCTLEIVRDDAALERRIASPFVALDEHGRDLDTRALAAFLAVERDQGTRALDFVIGGAHGLPPVARERAALTLRLSSLTLAHRVARVVLLEQLYRCACVLAGHPYHHA